MHVNTFVGTPALERLWHSPWFKIGSAWFLGVTVPWFGDYQAETRVFAALGKDSGESHPPASQEANRIACSCLWNLVKAQCLKAQDLKWCHKSADTSRP